MYFHVEERRAWLRSHTHTVVFDHDPDFARFAREPSGRLQRMLRIWLAEGRGERMQLCAFLGTLTCCMTGPSFRELRRLLRLTTAATTDRTTARRLRRNLIALLRQRTAPRIEATA